MEHADVYKRIRQLERRMFQLSVIAGVLVFAVVVASVGVYSQKVKTAESPQVLRLRGLIIEDTQGHARILIGAPVPTVPDRLRRDSPSTSIVFLDDKGHDRFLLGEMVSASPSFHRIGASYGLNIYDPEGQERGGMGFISNGTTVSRATIALDRPGPPSTPGDAWGAMVDDKTGFAGTGYIYAPEISHGNEAILIGTQGHRAFISFKDVDHNDRSMFAVDPNGGTSFRLYDKQAKVGPNLLKFAQELSSESNK